MTGIRIKRGSLETDLHNGRESGEDESRDCGASSSSDLHVDKEIVTFTGEVATCPRSWEFM